MSQAALIPALIPTTLFLVKTANNIDVKPLYQLRAHMNDKCNTSLMLTVSDAQIKHGEPRHAYPGGHVKGLESRRLISQSGITYRRRRAVAELAESAVSDRSQADAPRAAW